MKAVLIYILYCMLIDWLFDAGRKGRAWYGR